ncbi:MAG: hypothetical protein OSA81_00810 [Longimicrobiales bacterium]|nr:hypothetical protein [Longimicrobiales bacterium]
MLIRTTPAFLAALVLAPIAVQPVTGQDSGDLGRAEALQRLQPDLYDLVVRLERAHGVLLGELAREGQTVRESGGDVPTFGFEFDMVDRLTFLVQAEGTSEEEADAAESGYAALGPRGAEIVRWGQAFQREVISILADPDIKDQAAALADAVTRYRSRPEAALPNVPKNMDILYGHEYALGFRSGYADLTGLLWAGHWLRLAATEPLTDLDPGPARDAGIDTVTTRYHAKLSYGEPPQFFPSEIPLAPAIAPGFIWLSPEAAMIWDNLSMLLEVLADVLASPETSDVQVATAATIDFFMDPEAAVTDQDEWEIMALRHGIFFQGGYPLTLMLENERNADGHAAHLSGGGGGLVSIPGMPRG